MQILGSIQTSLVRSSGESPHGSDTCLLPQACLAQVCLVLSAQGLPSLGSMHKCIQHWPGQPSLLGWVVKCPAPTPVGQLWGVLSPASAVPSEISYPNPGDLSDHIHLISFLPCTTYTQIFSQGLLLKDLRPYEGIETLSDHPCEWLTLLCILRKRWLSVKLRREELLAISIEESFRRKS